MMEMIAWSFFFAYCVSNFECWFYCEKALHTAITDAVYCVKLVACDRRVANKLRKGLDKALHKSYNTTPAEEGKGSSLLFAAWALDHIVIISFQMVDHIWRLVCSSLLYLFFFSFRFVFLLCRRRKFQALLPPQISDHMTIILYSDLTTSLTINRTGVHGDKSAREYEKAVFA